MQKRKLRKFLAMLLCAANILGQAAPAMAQEVVPVAAEEKFETTQEVSGNDLLMETGEVSTNDISQQTQEVEVEAPAIEVLAEEEAAAPENLARGKNAVASSQEADSVRAANAVDGDKTSRNSRWGSTIGAGPHWIYVDLETEQQIRTVGIFWETRKATSYEVQIATELATNVEDTEWETVETFDSNPTERTQSVVFNEAKSARYVRLLINTFTQADPDTNESYNTISIYELEVYSDVVDVAPQDPEVNVARGKTAQASSTEDNNLVAAKAVDGNTSDRASRWSTAQGSGPHWIYVDLGKEQNVKGIRIFWETRKATAYKIQVANPEGDTVQDGDWRNVHVSTERPTSVRDVINLTNVERARFVRLYIDRITSEDPDGGVPWNTVSIYELEIYGGDVPVDIMESITIAQPEKGAKKLTLDLPEIEGKTVTYNGTDYEQLIDRELNIYQPVVDVVATVSIKVTDNEDPKDYQFKDIPLTIQGEYTVEAGDNAAPNVLPALREWKGRTGNFTITENTRVVYKEEIFKAAAEALAKDYQLMEGKSLTVVQAEEAGEGDIFFKATSGKGLFKEGYYMDIDSKIVVEAEEATGAYWATRTILQSIKSHDYVPKGITRDYPLYEVRSFILDVGRKTFTLDYLKQIVQEMAWYKMNDFHVHLNDNFIFLEYYTRNGLNPLTAYSGFRLESDIIKGGNGGLNKADLTSKDLFYTKNEFREFIKESRNYGVNIIPEIDTPAHSLALTKVRPDLRHGQSGRDNDHLNLVGKYQDSLSFVQSIFDEYMGASLEDPVFDEDTIVHIGCDEYNAGPRAFRQFSNDMIKYVQDSNRTVRMWGSLTATKEIGSDKQPLPNQLDVTSENVQMNLWNFGYANWDEMYEEGFDLITCNDGGYYIVPNAGYYGDYLGDGSMYNNPINTRDGVTIPAGDKQMLGAAFAVWNDMIDVYDNGISEYDVYDRIKKTFAMFGSNLWGKDTREGKAPTLQQAQERYAVLGSAPGNDFEYKVENKDGVIAHYPMDNLSDEKLTGAVNSEITAVDGKNALKLNGSESYVKTELTTVGLNNSLRVKVKRTSASNQEQILFESPYGSIKAVQTGTGRVGFSRENFDFSFNYTLPLNEWVELEFKNAFEVMKLYVNGQLVDTLGDNETILNNNNQPRPMIATMMLPVEKIGSESKAFIGYVDDVRLGVENTYNSTMELDYALIQAAEILEAGENEALAALVNEAKELLNNFAPEAASISELVTSIKAEIEKVEVEKANYDNVDEYLAAIPEDLTVFTKETVDVLLVVKNSIRRDLPSSMQSIVDGYERSLAKAIAGLEVEVKPDVNFVASEAIREARASSQQSDSGSEGPAKNVIDGNPATIWHSNYKAGAVIETPHWIQIELKEETSITEVIYVPRSGGGNGNFTGYELKIGTTTDNLQTVKSGQWDANGQEKVITLDAATNVKFVRLVATSSAGNFGSAAEIKLRLANITPDLDGLNALISKIEALEKGNYEDTGWTALQEKLQAAKTLAQQTNPNANEVEIMKRELSEKLKNLRLTSTPVEEIEIAGPYNLDVVVTGEDSVEISFERATGGEGLRYQIVITEEGSGTAVATLDDRETTVTVGDLPKDTAYVVTVRAKDSNGNFGYPISERFVLGDAGSDTPDIPDDPDVPGEKEGIWVEGVEELYYTGAKQTLDLTVYDGDKELTLGKDYTVSYKNNQKAYDLSKHNESEYAKNAPQAIIKMKGDYKGSEPVYFSILPIPIDDDNGDIIVDDIFVVAGKKKQTPAPVITWKGKKLSAKDFEVKEYIENKTNKDYAKNPGTYQLTLVGKGNFEGERPIILTIKDKAMLVPMSKIKVKNAPKKVTWDAEQAATEDGITLSGFTVWNGKTQLTPGVDYEVRYENNKAAGTATLVLTGIEKTEADQLSYQGVKRVNFTIAGSTMSKAKVVIPKDLVFYYTGEEIEPLDPQYSDKVTVTGAAEGTYTVDYDKNINKGTATIILTGDPEKGVTGVKKQTFKIQAAVIEKDTDEEDKRFAVEIVDPAKEPGEAEGEVRMPFTKGGVKPAIEVTAPNGEVLKEGIDYTLSYKNNTKLGSSNAGKKAPMVVIKGKGNYQGTEEVPFTIIPKDVNEGQNAEDLTVVLTDKVVSTKKNGWKSTVKVVDRTGKTLSKGEADTKNAVYAIESLPADLAEGDVAALEAFMVKENPAEQKNLTEDPSIKLPVGTTIRVSVALGGGNYAGEVSGTYRIIADGYDISKATFKMKNQEYTGNPILIDGDDDFTSIKLKKVDVKGQLTMEGENATLEVVPGSYVKNVNKGTAKVTLRGVGEYGGTKTVTFKIEQRDISVYWNQLVYSLLSMF